MTIALLLRRLSLVTLALGLSLALTSCPSQRTNAVTVAVALLPSEQEPYQRVLDRFSDSTGIQVTLIVQQYQQIRNALEAEAIAGRGELDIVELDVHLLGAVREYMRRLDTVVGALPDLFADASAASLEAGRDAQGGYIFLPHRLNWQAMIYDVVELSSPPTTWDELLRVARSRPGSVGLKGARYEGMVCDLFPFLWQAGGDPLRPTAPGTLTALRFLKQLAPSLNRAAPSYRENTVLQAQERQEILLHFNWPFVVPLLSENGLLGTRIGIAPLPAGPAGSATVLGGGYLGIPRTAPHPKAAAQLLEFLVSNTVQEQLARDLGWFPVRESAWQSLGELEARFGGYLKMRNQVRSRPSLPEYDRLSALWQDAFSRILFQDESPDQVAAALSHQIEQLLHRGP
jgi:ABC-type glycerol-3-phosphate transport system substrate-binding protein